MKEVTKQFASVFQFRKVSAFNYVFPPMKLPLLLVFTFCAHLSGYSEAGRIVKGELDLSNWDPHRESVVPLTGEWRFYWLDLLTTDQLDQNPFSFAQLSIPWNEQLIDGKTLPNVGYATYALRIKLPADLTEVAFEVPAVFNCYSFWINDKLICASGQVGSSPDKTIPRWKPNTVLVKVPAQTIHVVFQIANFQNTRGGCAEVMRIGEADHLIWLDGVYHTTGKTLVIFCALLWLTGMIIFYYSRPVNILYFSFLSLAYMLRFLFSDLYLAIDFGIDLPWIVAAKIEYATVPLIIITAAMFMGSIYPREFKKPAQVFFQITSLVSLALIIFVPSGGLMPLLTFLQILGLFLAAYSAYSIVQALLINRSGAWISALSMGAFVLVASYNIYAFIMVLDLNRTLIHAGYASALILCAISLFYRTPLRLKTESNQTLRYEDFFPADK